MSVRHLCRDCGRIGHDPGRCPSCQTAANRRHNMNPARAGYQTRAYRAARSHALAYSGSCACGCGETSDLTVHHIDGNTLNNDPSNLMVMARSCHTRMHKAGGTHPPTPPPGG